LRFEFRFFFLDKPELNLLIGSISVITMDGFGATRRAMPSIGSNPLLPTSRRISEKRPQKCFAAQPSKEQPPQRPKNPNMSKREARNAEEAAAPEGK
jgi:hypothetical protein